MVRCPPHNLPISPQQLNPPRPLSVIALRNACRAKQQLCQCQTCTNFKGYQRVLSSLPKLFKDVTHPPEQVERPAAAAAIDADGVANGVADSPTPEVAWEGADALARLLAFCALDFKSAMVADVLCPGALDFASSQPAAAGDDTNPRTAKVLDCLNGKCSRCGFKKLWSEGLRKKLVVRRRCNDGTMVDDLRPDAPVELQSTLSWTRISSSKAKAAGEAKELMHEPRSGTIVEFLDEFEREAMAKFPFHKFTIVRQKAMAAEFERNRCPGWAQFDVDFAENGSIITAEEVQSQYWKINSFTLFVQVVSWLVSKAWVSRTSRLACGMAVTVELEGSSEPDSLQPGKGSYWAEVVSVPTVDANASDEVLQVTTPALQASPPLHSYSESLALRHTATAATSKTLMAPTHSASPDAHRRRRMGCDGTARRTSHHLSR